MQSIILRHPQECIGKVISLVRAYKGTFQHCMLLNGVFTFI
uniref:Uncharacterized protein n=1 Tax=Rhizophora mucronata TaxID=61149 RepID=A0A2P2N991_RHIMU